MVFLNFFLFILKILLIYFFLSDIGEMDDIGYIVFIGCKGDYMMFKYGGDKIYLKYIIDVVLFYLNIFELVVSLIN